MHPDLVAVARSRGGVFTRTDALEAGYSAAEVRSRLSSGRWRRLRRGLYADAEVDVRTALFAAVLETFPGSFLSHHSAAAVHGLALRRPDWGCVHVTVPGGRARRRTGVAVHAGRLTEDELCAVDGLVLTGVPRTALDLARVLPFPDAVVVLDDALRRHPGARADLTKGLGAATGAGSAGLRRALAFADGRSESVGESLSRVAIAAHGLPRPGLQVSLGSSEGGPIGRVDFLWPDRTVGEFDGRVKYREPGDLWAEKLREDRLREAGFEVVRWTWADVVGDFGPVAGRIRAAIARAERRP